MKNILLVDGGTSFGGSLIVVARLANYLDHAKYRPVVVTSTSLDAVQHHFNKGVKVYYVGRYLSYVHRGKLLNKIQRYPWIFRKLAIYAYAVLEVLSNADYSLKLKRVIKNEKIDIIHANNNTEPAIIARKMKLPCVWHFHGFVNRENEWHRNLISRCDRFVSISKAVSKSVIEEGFADDAKLKTLYNPIGDVVVHTEKEKVNLKRKLGLKEGIPIIGMFGRLVEWKGHLQFLDGLKLLAETHPDVQAIIVGDDSEYGDYSRKLRSHAEQIGVSDKITYCGYVKDTSLYYQICSVIAHCSIEPEPFGLVITEAMQNQVPVVASSIGAGPEIVTHGSNGFLVNPYDTDKLAKFLGVAINDNVVRELFISNAFEYVSKTMDPARYASEIQGVYDCM